MIMVKAHGEEAGYHVKDFIEKHKRLPYFLSCSCYSDSLKRTPQEINLTMPQFLYVSTSLLDVNISSVEVIDVNPPTVPSGAYLPGVIEEKEYRAIAKNIKNFIEARGRAPNYANSSRERLPYETLIYMYARIWAFMGENLQPPHYVKV